MLFLSYSLHELTLYAYYSSLFFVLTYISSFRSKKKNNRKKDAKIDWSYKAIVYSISHLLVFAQKHWYDVHWNQRTNERMKRRKWCILDDILRFMRRVLIHTSNHGEKWGSGGYHLKKKRKYQERDKRWRKKKKRKWNTEANVSSESPMNFPAVKRTAFWLLIISIFVIFCRL